MVFLVSIKKSSAMLSKVVDCIGILLLKLGKVQNKVDLFPSFAYEYNMSWHAWCCLKIVIITGREEPDFIVEILDCDYHVSKSFCGSALAHWVYHWFCNVNMTISHCKGQNGNIVTFHQGINKVKVLVKPASNSNRSAELFNVVYLVAGLQELL